MRKYLYHYNTKEKVFYYAYSDFPSYQHFTMHGAIMTKEEKAAIKTKVTRQWSGNIQMEKMGEGCADRENGLHPPWKEMDSRQEEGWLTANIHFPGKILLGNLKNPQDCKTLTPFSERLKLCTTPCGLGTNMSSPSRTRKGNNSPKLTQDASSHFFLPVFWGSL